MTVFDDDQPVNEAETVETAPASVAEISIDDDRPLRRQWSGRIGWSGKRPAAHSQDFSYSQTRAAREEMTTLPRVFVNNTNTTFCEGISSTAGHNQLETVSKGVRPRCPTQSDVRRRTQAVPPSDGLADV